jgi:MFS family permease
VLGCGALSQAIAIARLYVTLTHSGLAAGFGMVCAPLPGVALALLAGSLGDRVPVQKFLVFLDALKGVLTLGFLFCASARSVFAVMLVVNAFDVLYLPSKNKLLTLILPKERLLDGNSALIGGVGAASLLTPLLVGLLLDRYPAAFASSWTAASIFCRRCFYPSSASGLPKPG